RPRYTQIRNASASVGSLKTWITIHKQATNPKANRTRSPGVSYADQTVSLCGWLTLQISTISRPMNAVRRTMPVHRRRGGISDTGPPGSEHDISWRGTTDEP